MVNKRRGVSLNVDEAFFNSFEKERQREQRKLRTKLGSTFSLSHKKFTEMLARKNFVFKFPKQKPLIKKTKKRRRRL